MGLFSFVGDILGDVTGSNKATKTATRAAQTAVTQNNALAGTTRDANTTLLNPYVQDGAQARAVYNPILYGQPNADYAGLNNYLNITGYTDQLDNGSRGVVAGQATGGMLNSGATLKALERYRLGLRGGAVNNYLGMLSGQVGQGFQATGALAGVNNDYLNQISGNNNSLASVTGNAALSRAANNTALIGAALGAAGKMAGGA